MVCIWEKTWLIQTSLYHELVHLQVMKMRYLYILLCLLIVVICPVQAFAVHNLEYTIYENGNALVSAQYELSLIEKVALLVPTIKDEVRGAIKTEYGEKAEIIVINETDAQFTIPGFADLHEGYIQTPLLTFENVKTRMESYWFTKYLNIDYSPDITTVKFFDGQEFVFYDQMVIPPVETDR